MGVGNHEMLMLRLAFETGGALGRTLMVGRQAFSGNFAAQLKSIGYPIPRDGQTFIEDMLTLHFGASSVDSIDASPYQGASIIWDLNNAGGPSVVGKFDTILEFGTIEHVFDIANSLRVLNELLAPGGRILHSSPSNGFSGHGFWQVSPVTFDEWYSQKNGFTACETWVWQNYGLFGRLFWWRYVRTTGRVFVFSSNRVVASCLAVKGLGSSGDPPPRPRCSPTTSRCGICRQKVKVIRRTRE